MPFFKTYTFLQCKWECNCTPTMCQTKTNRDFLCWQFCMAGSWIGHRPNLLRFFLLLHPYNHNFLVSDGLHPHCLASIDQNGSPGDQNCCFGEKKYFLYSRVTIFLSSPVFHLPTPISSKMKHEARLFAQEFQWRVSMYSTLQSSLVIFNS